MYEINPAMLRSFDELADTNPETLSSTTAPNFCFRYVDLGATSAGSIHWKSVTEVSYATSPSRARRVLRYGDVLFGTVRPNLQSHGYFDRENIGAVVASTGFSVIRAREGVSDSRYLLHCVMSSQISIQANRDAVGSSYPALNDGDVRRFEVFAPPIAEQAAIAKILDTLDTTIRQTEAIIEKLKLVKQGLQHDLLTRGIDANGELRPPQSQAPHLYKNSPLGWIPNEWNFFSIGQIVESIVDGPFGSNLKTEHYVELPGVRVVRLQNIDIGEYDDTERAYVSAEKAANLVRNEVLPGDVLIAALGDESYPVGRACSYPTWLPKAINKADCFRLRPEKNLAIGEFVVHSMNGYGVRRQAKSFEQGVTLQRINIGNLRKIQLLLPPISEQILSCEKLAAIQHNLAENMKFLTKSRQQRSGLMDDLLTGRVRVTPLLDTADA